MSTPTIPLGLLQGERARLVQEQGKALAALHHLTGAIQQIDRLLTLAAQLPERPPAPPATPPAAPPA